MVAFWSRETPTVTLFPPFLHHNVISIVPKKTRVLQLWPEEEAEAVVAVAEMGTLPMSIDIGMLNRTILCYSETIYRFNGLWVGPDPLIPFISLFLVQLTFSMAVIHLLVLLLKPFNQPPFIAEVLVSDEILPPWFLFFFLYVIYGVIDYQTANMWKEEEIIARLL